jgi:hypothetical protein
MNNVFVDAAVDLSAKANQMAGDLGDDVVRCLRMLEDFTRVPAEAKPDPRFPATKGDPVDPAALRDLVRDRLRRADLNFERATNLITERRKEIAELLEAIA